MSSEFNLNFLRKTKLQDAIFTQLQREQFQQLIISPDNVIRKTLVYDRGPWLGTLQLGSQRWRALLGGATSDSIAWRLGIYYYRKHRFAFGDRQALDVVVNTSIITHPTYFFLHTTKQARLKLARLGELTSQSLLTQLIIVAGRYWQKTIERAHHGIIGTHAPQKIVMINNLQDHLMQLFPLERLIHAMPVTVAHQQHYREQVEQTVLAFRAYLHKLPDSTADQRRVDYLLARLQQNELTAEELDNALIAFLREQALVWINRLAAANQALSFHRGACLHRGELNSICVELQKCLDDYQFDCHNPVLREHQLSYDDDDATTLVTLDAQEHGYDNASLHSLARAICVVQGTDRLDVRNGRFNDDPLLRVRATKWRNFGSPKRADGLQANWQQRVARVCILLLRFLTRYFLLPGLLMQLLAMVQHTLLGETLNGGVDLYFRVTTAWLARLQKYWLGEQSLPTNIPTRARYQDIRPYLGERDYILGIRFGNFLHYQIVRGIYAVLDGFIRASVEALERVISRTRLDFELGYRWLPNAQKDFSERASVARLGAFRERVTPFFAAIQTYHERKTKKFRHEIARYQTPLARDPAKAWYDNPIPYHLQPPRDHGLLVSCAVGVQTMRDVFAQNIFAKHAGTGTLFFAIYVTGLCSVLTPEISMKPIWQAFLRAQHEISRFMAGDGVTKGFSVAITEAEAGAALFESLVNGVDGWLVTATQRAIEDPAKVAIAGLIAYSIGHMVTYDFEIPWLSEHLSQQMGELGRKNVLALSLVGLKLGVGLYELLQRNPDPSTAGYLDTAALAQRLCGEAASPTPLTDAAIEEHTTDPAFLLLQERMAFWQLLIRYQPYLSYLPEREREWLRELAEDDLGLTAVEVRGLMSFVKDSSGHSTMRIFFGSLLNYVVLSCRCSLALLCGSFSRRPFRELVRQLKDDIRSVATCLAIVVNLVASFPWVMLGMLSDVLINLGANRVLGWLGIDEGTYAAYAERERLSLLREGLTQRTTQAVIQHFAKETTGPHPVRVIEMGILKAGEQYQKSSDVISVYPYLSQWFKAPAATEQPPRAAIDAPSAELSTQ